MQLEDVFVATILIGLMLVTGKQIRNHIRTFRRFYIPSSLIGGILALFLGEQVLGRAAGRIAGEDATLADGVWPERILEIWSAAPGLLISVVFAGLFLGKTLPKPAQIWKRAGPMVMHGQTLAWGQYVIGIGLTVLLLTPIWSTDPMAGALIEIGFEGGHGTAAGLSGTFRELGFEDGADLALAIATIGVVAGVLLGTILINWGVARNHIPEPDEPDENNDDTGEHDSREKTRPPSRYRDRSIEPLSIHLGLIGLSIAIGWLILRALVFLESELLVPMGWPELMRHIPLFPLAMIGGFIVQLGITRVGAERHIDRRLVNRVSGAALDLLIVAAMATLSLAALGNHFWPFLLLCTAGIGWNLFGLLVLAPKMFPENWMQNGLANFGQGMGMTVVGLLLVRMSDPQDKTGAMNAFGYKQLLFEPIVGGGLFTAASLPLIAQYGPLPVLAGVSVVMLAWLILGLKQIGLPEKDG